MHRSCFRCVLLAELQFAQLVSNPDRIQGTVRCIPTHARHSMYRQKKTHALTNLTSALLHMGRGYNRGAGCGGCGARSPALTSVAIAKWSRSWNPAGSFGREPGTCAVQADAWRRQEACNHHPGRCTHPVPSLLILDRSEA
jgi:hypothetical protein